MPHRTLLPFTSISTRWALELLHCYWYPHLTKLARTGKGEVERKGLPTKMLIVCRAEDGEAFEVNATLRSVERLGSLEAFLSQETGVAPEYVLAYLSDGRRLENANVREVPWGSEEPTEIYVFNKMYLDMGVDEVVRELKVESTNVDATTSVAQMTVLHDSILHQHAALQTASLNVSLNVLALENAWAALSTGMRREIQDKGKLVDGVQGDLDTISRIRVHPELLGKKEGRTLGEYVSTSKMRQVADACRRVYAELSGRFDEAEVAIAEIRRREEEIRGQVNSGDGVRVLEEVKGMLVRARPDELAFMIDAKNAYTYHVVLTLKMISSLNHMLTLLPPMLTALQAVFKPPSNISLPQTGPKPISLQSFTHLARLHSMAYAYGATLIEIVRRKQFRRVFLERAQGVSDVMTKMAAQERKRRVWYRSEVKGVVPFEVRGVAEVGVEGVDVRVVAYGGEALQDDGEEYAIERTDVDDFVKTLAGIEREADAPSNIVETRVALSKLIIKMDGLEEGFDRIAEKSLLSASLHLRRRSIDAETEIESFRRERDMWMEEREAWRRGEAERRREKQHREDLQVQLAREQDTTQALRERLDTELEGKDHELDTLRRDNDTLQRSKDTQVDGARRELDDVKHQLSREVERGRDKQRQLAEYERAIRDHLAEADGDRAVLERRYAEVLVEKGAVERELGDVSRERDYLALKLDEATEELARIREEFEESRAELDVVNADARGLRAELGRVERVIEKERQESDVQQRHTQRLYDELVDRSDRLERELKESRGDTAPRAKEWAELSMTMKERIERATAMAKAIIVQGQPGKHQPGEITSALGLHFDPPHDSPSDPTAVLEDLKVYLGYPHVLPSSSSPQPGDLLDILTKVSAVIRKWQKQCKEYRERAKARIVFRNFAKGDLALFLPTRGAINASSGERPWAAFNVFFPHYFLQATGHLGEQLRTREWIVARITSINERVVNASDPTSNPYGLSDGIKYYMLQVEDWTQQPPPSAGTGPARRRSSGNKSSTAENTSPAAFSDAGTSSSILASSRAIMESAFPPPEGEVQMGLMEPFPKRMAESPPARPSSLSRLLAQADETELAEASEPASLSTIPMSSSLSPKKELLAVIPEGIPPPDPSSHSPHSQTAPRTPQINVGSLPPFHQPKSSPLRPASRASTTSRFSLGPSAVGKAKVAEAVVSTSGDNEAKGQVLSSPGPSTTRLRERAESTTSLASLGKAAGGSVRRGKVRREVSTPSPSGSMGDGLEGWRRRTTSYSSSSRPVSAVLSPSTSTSRPLSTMANAPGHTRTASSTLATLASSWGVTFGRKKKPDVADEGGGEGSSTS